MADHRPRRDPVRPTGAWMLRHARQMRTDPLRFLTETSRDLGPMVEFPIPGQRVLFVDDPQSVARVLVDHHRAYCKRTVQYDSLALVTGSGLLTADDDVWRPVRRLQQPAFHHEALAPLADAVVRAVDHTLDGWTRAPAGSVVDVDAAMMRTALEVVGSALFGADLRTGAHDLVTAVLAALEQVVARAQNPLALPLGVPTPGHRRLRRALATLDRAVERLVAERRLEPRSAPIDLLDLLLASGLPDRQVRDEVVTTIVAGHETVASALTWAFALLTEHPRWARELSAEVDAVAGGRAPGWTDYPALVRTRQVLDETLRLYPPAWVITRRALEPDVLADVAVAEGTLVIVSTYALHRRPDVWPDPEAFRPDRMAGRRTRDQRLAYLPFGAGPRLCIGRDMALLEATLVLARVAQRCVLSPVRVGLPRADALVTIRPRGGLPMRVAPR